MYKNMADYYQYIFPSHKKIEFLNTEFKGFNDLLDVGCSDGRVAKGLSDKGFNIEAFDLNEEMIRVARHISKNGKDFNVSLIDLILLKLNRKLRLNEYISNL